MLGLRRIHGHGRPTINGEKMKRDKLIICLFGMADCGKTTVANAIAESIWSATTIDAHTFRAFSGNDDYSKSGRIENINALANYLDVLEGGGCYILSFNIPTKEMRDILRQRHDVKFVHCKCDLNSCRRRDKKGLYKKVGIDDSVLLPGINMPFDFDDADLVVSTADHPYLTPEGNARMCSQLIIDEYILPWNERANNTNYEI